MPDENQLPEPERISPTDETAPNPSIRVSPTARTVPAWPPAQQTFRRGATLPPGMTLLLIILTANSHIYATATAQVGVTATLTAQTDNATATATTLTSIFTQATSGTAALTDPLSDNSGNNKWDQTSKRVDGMCVFTGGDYHVLEARQGFFQPCLAETTNFSDFAYQVQMTIDSGRQDGIIFRANSITMSFYLFRIGMDGSYALDLYHNRELATTLSSGYSGAIATGLKQANEIAVIAYKGTLYLYTNQQFIAAVLRPRARRPVPTHRPRRHQPQNLLFNLNFSTLKRVVNGHCSCRPQRESIHTKPAKVK